jgi:hypothetical protein
MISHVVNQVKVEDEIEEIATGLRVAHLDIDDIIDKLLEVRSFGSGKNVYLN